MRVTSKHYRELGKILVQTAFSAGMLAWLFHEVNWRAVPLQLLAAKPGWILAGAAFWLLSIVPSTLRWGVVLHALNRQGPASLKADQHFRDRASWGWGLWWLLRINWVGEFFNQILPGAVSGDVLRAYYTRHMADTGTLALAAVFGDRFIGMGSALLVAVTAYLLGGLVPGLLDGSHLAGGALADGGFALQALPYHGGVVILLASAYLTIVTLIVSPLLAPLGNFGTLGRKLHEIRLAMRAILRQYGSLALAVLASVTIQGLSIAAFWAMAGSLGSPPEMLAIWMVWPVINLLLAVPISAAGWGLREGLVVFTFTHLGMTAAQSLTASVLYGLVQMVTTLPAVPIWLTLRKRGLAGANGVGTRPERTD